MIGTDEKQTYLDEGYCLNRHLIPKEAILAVRARVNEMMEDRPEWAARSWQVIDPERKLNSQGQSLPIGIQRPARFEPVFDVVAHHPNLVASMAALLGGEVVLQSASRQRVVKAADFQLGMLSTAREADEIISAARFPVAEAGAGYGFAEMALRHGDFALAAIAVKAGKTGVRIAIGGVADRPMVRNFPAGIEGAALDDALNDLAWDLAAADDPHATARYRRELVRRLGRKTVEEAKSCRV